MKEGILIGIDPDVDKSGVCIMINGRIDILKTSDFFKLFDELNDADWFASLHDLPIMVYVECGFLNKGNWRVNSKQSQSAAAKTAENVGRNHETAKKICEMCSYLGIKFEQIRPTKAKINAKTFKSITKWEGQTNQEKRDAAMLIFGI